MQGSKEQIELLEQLFYMPNLVGWWYQIQNKYISSHKHQVMDSGDLEQIYNELENLHAKADDGGKERKKLVYASLRDDWLINAMGNVEVMWQEAAGEMGKELSDEWN